MANEDVELGVYDIAGRLVRHLQSGMLPAGEQRLAWDGRNDAGRDVSVGLYVVRVHAGSQSLNTKVFRLR